MKKFVKILCFMLAAVLLSSCLFACGNKSKGNEGGEGAENGGSTENGGSSEKDNLGKDNVVDIEDLLGGLQ